MLESVVKVMTEWGGESKNHTVSAIVICVAADCGRRKSFHANGLHQRTKMSAYGPPAAERWMYIPPSRIFTILPSGKFGKVGM